MLRLLLLLTCAGALPAPANVSSVSASTLSDACVSDTELLALVLVVSHPRDANRRERARAAYSAAELRGLRVRRLFVVGDAPDVDLRNEDAQHRDLLRLGHVERYRALSLKCLAAFHWALLHCAHARFVVKADDDAFVEYYGLTRYLDAVDADDAGDGDAVRGQLIHDFAVTRTLGHKHALSVDEFAAHSFPTFASGLLYAVPVRSLARLVAAARNAPLLPVEDAFFTGVLAEHTRLRRVHYAGVDRRAPALGCCRRGDEMFECRLAVMQQHQVTVCDELAHAYKAHGRHCFEHACAQYSPRLPQIPGVQCL